MVLSGEDVDRVLADSSLSPQEKRDRLRGCGNVGDCIERGLRTSLDAGDWTRFYWYVIAIDSAPRESYVPILIRALDMARDEPRIYAPDVILALSDLASPTSVPVLARTIAWRTEQYGGDGFTLDAMDALLHIVTPESRAVIASLVEGDRIEVRELAQDIVASPGRYW